MHFGQHLGQHFGQHLGDVGAGVVVVEPPVGPPVIYCVRVTDRAHSLVVVSHAASVIVTDGCDV